MDKEELKAKLRRKTEEKLNDRDRSAGRVAAETRLHTAPAMTNLQEEIRLRAYEIFEQRGGMVGSPDDDWYRAESELLSHYRRDPVCGNFVNAEYATIKEDFRGSTWYFCSEVCQQRFQLDPGKYTTALDQETLPSTNK